MLAATAVAAGPATAVPAAPPAAGGASTGPTANRGVRFTVALRMRDAATAGRAALAVSTPGSRRYGRYLTPAQFNSRYAPTTGTVTRVEDFLHSRGISVTRVDPGRVAIEANGPVTAVERALRIGLRPGAVTGGRRDMVADRAPALPAPVAAGVLGVIGLGHPGQATPAHVGPVDPAAAAITSTHGRAAGPPRCSQYWGQHQSRMPQAYGRRVFPTALCAYSPAQLQTAYGLHGLIRHGRDGRHVRVAVLGAYALPTIGTDLARFSTEHRLPPFRAGQFAQTLASTFDGQSACNEPSWNIEEALDTETIHGLAPGATVRYVGAQDCSYAGMLAALEWIVETHSADVISNSWGFYAERLTPAPVVQAANQIFVQAALEGIGVYFCDMDNGDMAGVGGNTAPDPVFPASDPWVTGVGGTALLTTRDGVYRREVGWGDDRAPLSRDGGYQQPLPGTFYAGSGGGTSTLFPEPAHQDGVVPPALSTSRGATAMRVEPDMSADADPYTGYRIGYTDPATGQWETPAYGGTSLATPIIAATLAVAEQGGAPLGFINPALYAIANDAGVLHDPRPTRRPLAVAYRSPGADTVCDRGCLVTLSHDTTLTSTVGYDDVTGLGSPNAAALITALGRLRR